MTEIETSLPEPVWRAPDFITFTGVDAETEMARLVDIAALYPVEWGILLSIGKAGKEPRYMAAQKALGYLNSGLVTAAHVCGVYSQRIMNREPVPHFGLARRVQINHRDPDIEAARDYSRSTGFRVVLQTRDELGFPVGGAGDNRLEWLFDQSGGRGVEPEGWPPYPDNQFGARFGYAGGITPDNVVAKMKSIAATGPYWLDMESGVRDENDLFSIEKVRAVCEAVYGVR